MTPALRASARHWLYGIILAALGVMINRQLAPAFTDKTRSALALAGELIALAGLAVIMLGIRRRIQLAEAARPSGDTSAP